MQRFCEDVAVLHCYVSNSDRRCLDMVRSCDGFAFSNDAPPPFKVAFQGSSFATCIAMLRVRLGFPDLTPRCNSDEELTHLLYQAIVSVVVNIWAKQSRDGSIEELELVSLQATKHCMEKWIFDSFPRINRGEKVRVCTANVLDVGYNQLFVLCRDFKAGLVPKDLLQSSDPSWTTRQRVINDPSLILEPEAEFNSAEVLLAIAREYVEAGDAASLVELLLDLDKHKDSTVHQILCPRKFDRICSVHPPGKPELEPIVTIDDLKLIVFNAVALYDTTQAELAQPMQPTLWDITVRRASSPAPTLPALVIQTPLSSKTGPLETFVERRTSNESLESNCSNPTASLSYSSYGQMFLSRSVPCTSLHPRPVTDDAVIAMVEPATSPDTASEALESESSGCKSRSVSITSPTETLRSSRRSSITSLSSFDVILRSVPCFASSLVACPSPLADYLLPRSVASDGVCASLIAQDASVRSLIQAGDVSECVATLKRFREQEPRISVMQTDYHSTSLFTLAMLQRNPQLCNVLLRYELNDADLSSCTAEEGELGALTNRFRGQIAKRLRTKIVNSNNHAKGSPFWQAVVQLAFEDAPLNTLEVYTILLNHKWHVVIPIEAWDGYNFVLTDKFMSRKGKVWWVRSEKDLLKESPSYQSLLPVQLPPFPVDAWSQAWFLPQFERLLDADDPEYVPFPTSDIVFPPTPFQAAASDAPPPLEPCDAPEPSLAPAMEQPAPQPELVATNLQPFEPVISAAVPVPVPLYTVSRHPRVYLQQSQQLSPAYISQPIPQPMPQQTNWQLSTAGTLLFTDAHASPHVPLLSLFSLQPSSFVWPQDTDRSMPGSVMSRFSYPMTDATSQSTEMDLGSSYPCSPSLMPMTPSSHISTSWPDRCSCPHDVKQQQQRSVHMNCLHELEAYCLELVGPHDRKLRDAARYLLHMPLLQRASSGPVVYAAADVLLKPHFRADVEEARSRYLRFGVVVWTLHKRFCDIQEALSQTFAFGSLRFDAVGSLRFLVHNNSALIGVDTQSNELNTVCDDAPGMRNCTPSRVVVIAQRDQSLQNVAVIAPSKPLRWF